MRESTARQLPDEDRSDAARALEAIRAWEADGRRLRLVEPHETAESVERAEPGDDPAEPTDAPVRPEPSRRTVTITGQAAPTRRRRSPTATKVEARPDRIALWAVLLGLFLVFMAVATANAATF